MSIGWTSGALPIRAVDTTSWVAVPFTVSAVPAQANDVNKCILVVYIGLR